MGKLVVALTLITNLLVCPFRCMSGEWDAAGEDGAARPACSCCQPYDDCDDSPPKDDKRENDWSCPSCICEGATLQDGRDVSTIDVQVADAHGLISTGSANQCWVNSPPPCATNPPRCTGGRAALIAFQVWLI